jgi:hypothetical protein
MLPVNLSAPYKSEGLHEDVKDIPAEGGGFKPEG